jgi:hypothetical protein
MRKVSEIRVDIAAAEREAKKHAEARSAAEKKKREAEQKVAQLKDELLETLEAATAGK